jgi:hypothetical protein
MFDRYQDLCGSALAWTNALDFSFNPDCEVFTNLMAEAQKSKACARRRPAPVSSRRPVQWLGGGVLVTLLSSKLCPF